MQRFALLLILLLLAALHGCAYGGYGLYDDQRLMGTISADKKTAAKIKTALMNENFTGGWSVAVYSFYGHVFLVGEAPPDMQEKAMTIAHRYKPRSVTPHWFTQAASDTGNMVLAAKLRKELISAEGLSSSRIETEVNAGRVVLLGVVKDDAEKHLAIQTARGVPGVSAVTSYLMLPQKAGQVDPVQPEQADGLAPAGRGMDPAPGRVNTTPRPVGGSSGAGGGIESRDLP